MCHLNGVFTQVFAQYLADISRFSSLQKDAFAECPVAFSELPSSRQIVLCLHLGDFAQDCSVPFLDLLSQDFLF